MGSNLKLGLKRKPRSLGAVVLTLLLVVAVSYLSNNSQKIEQGSSAIQSQNPSTYTVTKFYDGDTIAINMNGSIEKVRLIGVDTPETHDPRKAVQCFGQAGADFTKNLIGDQKLRLEADPINQNRDRYNRLLRYVYLPDGRLVNAEIIKQGYGFAYLSFPFTKSDEFRQLQTEAREQNRGLWNSCTPSPNQYGGFTSNDVTQ